MHEQASDVVLLCTEPSVSVQTREKKRDGSDDRGLNKAQRRRQTVMSPNSWFHRS